MSKEINWSDIKKFANSLSEEQLKKEVFILTDDDSEGVTATSLEVIPADIYANKHNDEDSASLADLRTIHAEDFDIEDYELVTENGHPFIYVNNEEK